MSRRKLASLLAVGALVGGGVMFGIAAPANAVPSCVHVNISTAGSDTFTHRTQGTAQNTCSSVSTGKWKYQEYTNSTVANTYYGSCVSIAALFGQSVSDAKTFSVGIGTGTQVAGFVDC